MEEIKKIILEFYSENKYKIKDLIKKQFKGKENFGKLTDNYISFYTWNQNLNEKDFEQYKNFC